MKFQIVLVFLTALASAHSPSTCKALPKYCKYTSKNDMKQCHQLLAQRYINVAYCQPPAKTVTKTRIICATSVVTKTLSPPRATKKVTEFTIKTGKPTTQPTITLTDTATKLETTTRTDVTTVIEVDTVVETETITVEETATTTSTTTSSTTIPYTVQTTCAATLKRRVTYGKTKKPLPTSCSCFLTATKPAATKTAIVTKKKPTVTRTVYKIGGPRPTITRTITVTRYAAGPTLSAPETTTTSTTTLTQTDITSITETDTETVIATTFETETRTSTKSETQTVRATATAGACDDLSKIRVGSGRMVSHPNVVLQISGDAFEPYGAQSCCETCYGNNDCVYFRYRDEFCEVYFTKRTVTNDCTSAQCLRGRNPLVVGSGDGKEYYLGPCVGPQVA